MLYRSSECDIIPALLSRHCIAKPPICRLSAGLANERFLSLASPFCVVTKEIGGFLSLRLTGYSHRLRLKTISSMATIVSDTPMTAG